MRKVGDLMKDIGFNQDSSEDVQKAFIKNLIKQAYGSDVQIPAQPLKKSATKPSAQQLSFEFNDAEMIPTPIKKSM